jgi:hypothetical protein
MPSGPEGMHELQRSIEDVETALARLRHSAVASVHAPASDTPSSGDVADAERRLADLRAANRALQDASARLSARASAALGDQGRHVVRLQRALADDRVAPRTTGRMPETRRRRDNLALAPSFIVAGICASVLASLVADWGVNPFRGQRLAPPPAAAESGATAPAIALPSVRTVAVKPRAARSAGTRRRDASRSARRERAARAARAGRPSR